MGIDNWDQAETVYHRALESRPNDWRIHTNLGRFFGHFKRFEDAAKQYEKARTLMPQVGAIQTLAAEMRAKMGQE